MDFITSAQDVKRCEFCDENMVDMLCVVCSLKLCKPVLEIIYVMIQANIKLSNITKETRQSFFQHALHIPQSDVNSTAKNATKPFVPLALLPVLTRNTFS